MSFTTLNADLQNILLVNHSYMAKWLVFFTIILLSSYYLFIVWPNQKKTKFLTVGILRMILFALSFVYLLSSPLLLLLMTPEYSFGEFYTLPIIFYSIIASIIFVVAFFDFMRYGLFVMLRLAGLDINDPNVNEIARDIENNKHFIKLGKK